MRSGRRGPASARVFALSAFTSAFLLFMVQPMAARMLLPRFGGSPAVWTIAIVFFQCLLVVGYAYAHLAATRLTPRRLALAQAFLLVAAGLTLPPAVPTGSPGPGPWPVVELVSSLAAVCGLPFLVLSANTTLVQHLYARSARGRGSEPYSIYAASNAGSLVGLLVYPLAAEPLLTTSLQAAAWSGLFGVFAVLSLALAVLGSAKRVDAGPVAPESTGDVRRAGLWGSPSPLPVTATRRSLWLVRSAVGASLLMATTTLLTTDLAAAPLLWVIPLAVYLVTFIVAFDGRLRLARHWVAAATVAAVVGSLSLMAIPLVSASWVIAPALLTLAAGALLCHGDLAAERPDASRLTEYYLLIALGGALGGALNALVAPRVFTSVMEYPLTLVALAWLVTPGTASARATFKAAPPLLVMAALAGATILGMTREAGRDALDWLLVAPLILAYGALLAGKPGRFGTAALLFTLVYAFGFKTLITNVAEARSFFGVLRVWETNDQRVLMHGTTLHGAQNLDPATAMVPVGYYFAEGPLGSVLTAAPPGARLGVVGLGAGVLAVVARPDQRLDFIEIDPTVVEFAKAYFTYLESADAEVAIHIGDGRLVLATLPDGAFHTLVVDAFTSDAVPVHMLTAEALDLYLAKVSSEGVVVLHTSNRYFDLDRVLAGYVAERPGTLALAARYAPSASARARGAVLTEAVALTRSPAAAAKLAADRVWRDLDARAVTWTDDRADIVGVLKAWNTR